jgi:murein DD-endopeptidase MepM/ murein hydrolase activator NlpD
MQHQLETFNFYLLYGHLSLKDLEGLQEGHYLTRGQAFAHFGTPVENGNWPPHLHFQLILDIGAWEGDYPGVCKVSEAMSYLQNSPDPSIFLNMDPHQH